MEDELCEGVNMRGREGNEHMDVREYTSEMDAHAG